MKLSLAVQTPEVGPTIRVALLSGTFEEKLAKAARMGAQGVELMSADLPSSMLEACVGRWKRLGSGWPPSAPGPWLRPLG